MTIPTLPTPGYDTKIAEKVWHALTTPEPVSGIQHDPSDYDGFGGYSGIDDVAEFDTIASILAARDDIFPGLTYSLLAEGPEGYVGSYEVGFAAPGSYNLFVMHFLDRKNGTWCRSAAGREAALAYGVAIVNAYVQAEADFTAITTA